MKDKSFRYKFDTIRNKIDDFIRTKYPFIYKLCIKCKDYEYYSLRRFLSFPIGFLIGYIFYWVIVSRFEFPKKLEPILRHTIIALISLTYTVSVEMRTICWLVLPTFSGRTGRSFLIAFLITLLAEKPLTNTLNNSEEFFNSMSCCFGIGSDHMILKYKLIFKPMQEIVINLITGPPNITNISKPIDETNEELLSMFKTSGEREDNKDNDKSKKPSTLEETLLSQCEGKIGGILEACERSDINDHLSGIIPS